MTKLLDALENAKQNFKKLEKSGKNNFFKTSNGVHTYSTLEDIFDVRIADNKEGESIPIIKALTPEAIGYLDQVSKK